MCGLPGEGPADLDGIIEMAETIARLGKEVTGRYAAVVANVSNFVPKPQTPYQWNDLTMTEKAFHGVCDPLPAASVLERSCRRPMISFVFEYIQRYLLKYGAVSWWL